MQTKIIYEDTHVLVCHKPAGLATQSGRVGQPDVVSELKNYLMVQAVSSSDKGSGKGKGAPYLGVVHRLDQPVEGLLVFAKNQKAAAHLTKQLSKGSLNKQYYAVVCGKPKLEAGELVDYLIKDGNVAKVVDTSDKAAKGMPDKNDNGTKQAGESAKKAVLQYRLVSEMKSVAGMTQSTKGANPSEKTQGEEGKMQPICLLDIRIDTGRFHQIRVQMSHAGLPLLGDSKYGTQESIALSKVLNLRNVALYAYKVAFEHPITGKNLELSITPDFPKVIGNIS